MEDFISEIYEFADLIPSFKMLKKHSLAMAWEMVLDRWNGQKEVLAALCRAVSAENAELGSRIWNQCVSIGSSISNRRSAEIADLIDNLMPLLYDAMQLYGGIDVTEGDYRIFSSRSGFLSIENTGTSVSLSDTDPVWEAYEKANVLYFPNMLGFYSLGCELGYLAWQLYEISNRSLDIYIYEFDRQLADYAISYGVLSRISPDKLHLFVDKDQDAVMSRLIDDVTSKNSDADAVINIEQDAFNRLRPNWHDTADELMTTLSTRRNYTHTTQINYFRNRHNVRKMINELTLPQKVTDWVIVGGGPSVDELIDLLTDPDSEGKAIIATMTIYRKLIERGVKVDYLTVIDPNPRTFKHIRGMSEHDAVLIMSDCADWQYGEYYSGKKYLIPTSGSFFSEEYYESRGIKTWEPLGTVTSMSIEVAAYLGAKNIELIGVDLAYPGNKTHADGTAESSMVNTEGLIRVKSVDGGEVYTNHSMDYYRHEIEELIRKHGGIRFYNWSKHGAFISGCRND